MDLTCSGPGPHIPGSGILGTADRPVAGMLCPSSACQADSVAQQSVVAAQDANTATTRAALSVAMPRLTAIINQGNTLAAQSTAWTIAQQKAVAAAISDLALIERRLIREAINLRDAPD